MSIRPPAFLLALASFASALQAQPQLENPSFESWTSVGQATQEPAEWSSLKTSDGGAFINALVPQLCWRSTDAHTGSYSVNLRTVSSVAGDANGLLTNGRVHAELAIENSYMFTVQNDEQWRTTMTSRPDSIIGWFKADPETGDRPNLGALLHVDEGRLPAFGTEGNYVAGASWKGPYAQVTEWTRFSTPFQYLNDWDPEWILLILTAGDSAGSQVGTQVWYDDLALIYNVQCEPSVSTVAVSATEEGVFDVNFSTGGQPVGPVTFTVELSDINGDFSSPVVIGSVLGTSASGSIPCTIPAGTQAGSDYAIRVVADSPFYAPVGCSVQIELETGLGTATRPTSLVRWTENGLLMIGETAGNFECFDALGNLVERGRLLEGANTIPLDAHGMVFVRVTISRGSFTQRVVVP